MNNLNKIVCVAILMSSSQLMANQSTESNQIQKVISSYESYLNASDTKSIMGLYSDSPVFMPQHMLAKSGRTEVSKTYDGVFKTIDLNIKFTTYEIDVMGDTAWARTSSAGKTVILASGVTINEGNNEIFIFKKEHGNWKISRYLFSTTTPRQ